MARKQDQFVQLLKQYSVLLSKSQKPEIKAQKAMALQAFANECDVKLNIKVRGPQLLKKIHNLKRFVRTKMELINSAGNNHIKLKPFEQEMIDLLNGDHSSIPAFVSAGQFEKPSKPPKKEKPDDSEVQCNEQLWDTAYAPHVTFKEEEPRQQPTARSGAFRRDRHPDTSSSSSSDESDEDDFETAETRKLSTAKLKRLVLIEKLNLIRMKKAQIEMEEGV